MSRTATMLALLAAVLAGLILLELSVPPGANPDATPGPASAQPDSGITRDQAGGAAETVAAILARPLFRGDRRPAPAEANGTASGQPTDMPRLAGILLSSDGRKAIFQPAGKDRAIVVVVGETVGNWHVQEIAADAVTLAGPGGTRRLEPKFAAGGSSNAPFQQPPPMPGTSGSGAGGAGTNGPLFGGVGAQQNSGMDRPQGKH
ncbi:MAG: hypothetical protein JWM91_3989 [Rhodospirillales bacterium]|nr:hypothetical protein [Rhodospirillales bacterium]